MIGAVVGVQPFGGEACPAPAPKAGGPLYLCQPGAFSWATLMHERSVSVNTAAAGGNASLMTLD
jgi:RHH-type proline utilization regulon transcriptional repressor/proline dehydrogenase/delta 1-pyrroline-5-carboxylate dehydrogenase